MQVIAHRGASGDFPENTLLAFNQAITQQADGIEFDVQYHHSGHFVVFHDNYLERQTNGKGTINHYSLTNLQQLDAGQKQFIPTLEQALATINGRCIVNIEIKSSTDDESCLQEMTQKLMTILTIAINQHNFISSQLIVSSFNHLLLAKIKKLIPQTPTAALVASCPIDFAHCAEQLNAMSFNPSINIVNQHLVDDAHQRDLKVWVYTVDRKEDIAKCYDYGVDAVFTNYPNRTLHYINQLKGI